MATGQAIMFKADKGYGFIKPDDDSKNVYVHISSLQESGLSGLEEGQKVSYDLHTQDDKISAVNIKLI
ncbi:MAG: cold-shock protein [Micavibrio aeruginosavorus]|uniref:Cold-shock protein n=1 Tax=Micavibrio aeruginosavorus TaxID=349221 RepID=A0A2W5FQI1_9BACT|nr:MAG: cold-shock protein [Micavibrio aeruginosavorus]